MVTWDTGLNIFMLFVPVCLLIAMAVLCLIADIRARRGNTRRGFAVLPRRK